MFPQMGIPFGYDQGFIGMESKFQDNFADSSIFWAWRKFLGNTPAGKTITEEEGRLKIAVASTKQGRWDPTYNEAPRLFIGAISSPCEVITKLTEFTENNNVQAGLFLSKCPAGFGSNIALQIVRRKSTEVTPINGIAVTWDGISVLASTAITVLPLWFRLRIGNASYYSMKVCLDYSIDGVNWVNLWTVDATTVWNSYSLGVGLYAQNNCYLAQANAAYASFDYFKMLPKTVN
jgi:hypothetical protein